MGRDAARRRRNIDAVSRVPVLKGFVISLVSVYFKEDSEAGTAAGAEFGF